MCSCFFFLGSHLPPAPSPEKTKQNLPNCFVEWLHNFAFLLTTYEEVSFSLFTPLGVTTVFNFVILIGMEYLFTLAALGPCC